MPVQLDMHVPNARTHISKTPDVRAIMSLQDVRVGSTDRSCKKCRHEATVRRQCSASSVDHLCGTATVLGD
jgi:hypothetical protein